MNDRPAVIMLVDDDQDFLDINESLLVASGYQVLPFCDRESAFGQICRQKPDLVITDLMMESLDAGFSLARRIKQEPALADLPVIIVTAISSQLGFNFTPRTPEELKSLHADAFLEKPVPPDKLLATVRELLK
ncbi:MAG: response regulator [Bradymonadales bacterium]|nr:response regulator [Bradymonadales bacterium]